MALAPFQSVITVNSKFRANLILNLDDSVEQSAIRHYSFSIFSRHATAPNLAEPHGNTDWAQHLVPVAAMCARLEKTG